MTERRDLHQAIEIGRSSLLRGPEWDALVDAVCTADEADVDEAVVRLLAA